MMKVAIVRWRITDMPVCGIYDVIQMNPTLHSKFLIYSSASLEVKSIIQPIIIIGNSLKFLNPKKKFCMDK